MDEHFGWVHARVVAALETAGFRPARHDARLASPGFHIYIGDGEQMPASASVHYDLQYEHIDWSPYAAVDLSCPLSFTLALRLPAEGGGLHVWDLDIHALRQMTPDQRQAESAGKRQATYHPYRPGLMALHNGHHLHQIARLSAMKLGDVRLTLQGHAVSTEQGWIVYW
jgi:hypothetical protein